MAAVDLSPHAPLSYDEAVSLQAVELQRAVALLSSLAPDDWAAQTACPDWDVRRMYLHVLGACEAGASMLENARQLWAGMSYRKQHGVALEAGLSAVQVRDRESLTPVELTDRLRAVAPRTVKGRRRIPGLVRNLVKIPIDGPVVEKWSLGYLAGTIYLRDLWMHRVDASRAVGRALEVTAEHDGRIVSDVVGEWARRHGRPYLLELTGPAGGRWSKDDSGERISMDAVEFCRTLAGRGEAAGLLTTVVPF